MNNNNINEQEQKTKTKRRRKRIEKTAEYYNNRFKEILEADEPIYSTSNPNKRLIIADEEVFKQCYADTPTRKTFPKYWFISDRCNLITMKSGKPKWIEGYKKNNTGKCYKYVIYNGDEMQRKNIEAHNLVALVFGSEVYGRAWELLEQDGVYSFGTKNKEKLSNTGHHKDSCRSNNTPQNIQIITNRVHTLLDKVPHPATNDHKFISELVELATKEEPNKITVLFDGYSYNPKTKEYTKDSPKSIHAVDSLKLTLSSMNQINTMFSALNMGVSYDKQ